MVDARPVYTQRAQHRTAPVRCVAAFHRVVLRWLVDGAGESGGLERGMWRTESRGEEREGRTQPAEERSEEEEEEGGPWGL